MTPDTVTMALGFLFVLAILLAIVLFIPASR